MYKAAPLMNTGKNQAKG